MKLEFSSPWEIEEHGTDTIQWVAEPPEPGQTLYPFILRFNITHPKPEFKEEVIARAASYMPVHMKELMIKDAVPVDDIIKIHTSGHGFERESHTDPETLKHVTDFYLQWWAETDKRHYGSTKPMNNLVRLVEMADRFQGEEE